MSRLITWLSVNTLVCLETGEGPCDFIICSHWELEQTGWQGDYFGIWTRLSNYYAMLLGLIYCTPRNTGQITFWEKDSGRPLCLCVSQREARVCARVCVWVVCVKPWKITQMRLLAGMSVSMLREIEGFKKWKGKIAGAYFDTWDGRRQVVLMALTSELYVCVHMCVCVCVCGAAWGGSGGSGGARPSALSFSARPPSKSCTAPTGIPNSPSRSSAGLQ